MYELLSAIWDPQSGIVTDNTSSFIRDFGNHEKSLPERFVYYHEDEKWFCLRSEDAERFLDKKMSNRKIPQKLDEMGLIQTKKSDRTIKIFKKEKNNLLKNVRFICLKRKAVANYLGVEDEYLPPQIIDKTDKHYTRPMLFTPSETSSSIQPELNEEVYKDFESQMCVLSDDDTPEDGRVLKHYIEESMKRSKKHR